jgi:hypothetical protein
MCTKYCIVGVTLFYDEALGCLIEVLWFSS